MSNESERRFPHLGNLSIALLEHLTKPIIGEDAQKILKEPALRKEQREELAEILERVEKEFASSYHDEELQQNLTSLPLASIPAVQSAVQEFYVNPTSSQLRSVLVRSLTDTLPKSIEVQRVESAVDHYLDILRRELVASSLEELRGKLDSLALQSVEVNAAQTKEILLDIRHLLDARLPIASAQSTQVRSSLIQLGNSVQRSESPHAPEVLVEIGQILEDGGIFMNQYDKLRNWLNRLTDTEFRDLVRTLLSPDEQSYLPRPIEIVSRGDFLGHMQQLRQLDPVEEYLVDKYPERLFGGAQ